MRSPLGYSTVYRIDNIDYVSPEAVASRVRAAGLFRPCFGTHLPLTCFSWYERWYKLISVATPYAAILRRAAYFIFSINPVLDVLSLLASWMEKSAAELICRTIRVTLAIPGV
jgi:hypothetical protein